MIEYIHFLGTGCGRPLVQRQLPCYLVGVEHERLVMLECGATVPTDDDRTPVNLAKIRAIVITSPDSELFSGLPAVLHSMRLLNRTSRLKILVPKELHALIRLLIEIDSFESRFQIEIESLEHKKNSDLGESLRIYSENVNEEKSRFCVAVLETAGKGQSAVMYTGKSRLLPSLDRKTLSHLAIIHDCTYSRQDQSLAKANGLATYSDAIDNLQSIEPDLMFYVHVSPRYNAPRDLAVGAVKPRNGVFAYDGLRYDLLDPDRSTMSGGK